MVLFRIGNPCSFVRRGACFHSYLQGRTKTLAVEAVKTHQIKRSGNSARRIRVIEKRQTGQALGKFLPIQELCF